MRFLYPLGLIGLVGIPILIIIYIIKNKYTEQTVSSTYLWELSERFLKRKKPISRLAGLISLLLQVFAVAFLSVALARPVFILPNSANDYCFVLDGSGSMNMMQGENTRLELAKSEIENLIDDAKDGSTYTLVYVGETTGVVYEKLEDKKRAITLLSEIQPTYLSDGVENAIVIAQEYFNENPAQLTYLVTDKAYEGCQYIELVNVATAQENYAVSSITYEQNGDNSLSVRTEVVSYESDKNLTVNFYLNGSETPTATKTVQAKKLIFTPVAFDCEDLDFDSLCVRVQETDALPVDNETVLFNAEKENEYTALLVSDRPFFIQKIIETVGKAKMTVKTAEEYSALEDEKKVGYDLYIFDSVKPSALPDDGAVWFFNLSESLDKTGFSYQNTVEIESKSGAEMELVSDGSTTAMALTKDLDGKTISFSRYIKYGRMRNFTTIFEYEGNPLVFSGTNDYGNREVVFAFDLHDTNLPLKMDYIVLCRNLLNYSFPTVVERVSYESGENAKINIVSGCKNIRIESPSGKVSYLDTNDESTSFLLSEVGTYRIVMTVGETPRVFHLYSSLGEGERNPTATSETVNLQGQASSEKRDGKYQELIIYFICLSLLFLADWGVYCYDKYQLR